MAGRKFNMGRQNEQVLNKEWHDLFMALKYLNNERYHNAETVQERQEQIPKRALRFQPDTLLDVIEVARDNAILEGKTVKFLGCKFEHIEKPQTSGVTKLGGNETKWVKPAHKAAKVSFLPSKKKSLEIEI